MKILIKGVLGLLMWQFFLVVFVIVGGFLFKYYYKYDSDSSINKGEKGKKGKWGGVLNSDEEIDFFLTLDLNVGNIENLSDEEIAKITQSLIKRMSYVSAIYLDDPFPIQNEKFKSDKENLAYLQSYFEEMYFFIVAQMFTLFKAEDLDRIAHKLLKLRYQEIQKESEWVESFLEENLSHLSDNPLWKQVKEKTKAKWNEGLKQYSGYNIGFIEENPDKTPIAKGASIIANEFYPNNVVENEKYIFAIGRMGASYLTKYLTPVLEKYVTEENKANGESPKK